MRSGTSIHVLSPRQLCNLAYALLAENRTREEREELDMELAMPLDPGEQYEQVMARFGETRGRAPE